MNKDYQMLLDLRSNVVALSQIKGKIKQIRNEINNIHKPKLSCYFYRSERAKDRFLEPYHKGRERSRKKLIACKLIPWWLSLLLVIGIILALAVFVISIKYGFTFFQTHQWDGLLGDDILPGEGQKGWLVVTIYMSAWIIVLSILWWIILIKDGPEFCGWLCMILSLLLYIGAFIVLLKGLKMGTFLNVIAVVAFPITTIIFFVICFLRILYCVFIIAVVSLPIVLSVGLIRLLIKWHQHIIHDTETPYNPKKEPDMREFYKSREYIEARAADERENEEAKKKYEAQMVVYNKRVGELEALVKDYDILAKQCEKNIRMAPLNADYKNINMVEILLYYFNYNRATTLVEAVNQYVSDRQMNALLGQLREQHDEQMMALNQINANLSGLRSDMKASCSALMRDLAKSREINERYQSDVQYKLKDINRKQSKLVEYAMRTYYDF